MLRVSKGVHAWSMLIQRLRQPIIQTSRPPPHTHARPYPTSYTHLGRPREVKKCHLLREQGPKRPKLEPRRRAVDHAAHDLHVQVRRDGLHEVARAEQGDCSREAGWRRCRVDDCLDDSRVGEGGGKSGHGAKRCPQN